MPHPEECIYQDDEGHKYNLTTITNDDGKPRFTASKSDYNYSFNPCISFTLGTSVEGSDCQSKNDVAVCRWHNYAHKMIGKQSSVKFGRYKGTKIPMLHYCGDPPWETTVLLKCDSKEEKGDFKVWRNTYPQEVVLNLTHKCACEDACLLNPTTIAPTTIAPTTIAPTTIAPTTIAPTTIAPTTIAPSTIAPTTTDPHDDTDIKKIVAWTVTGIVLLIAIIAIVVKRRDLRARWQQVMRRRQNDEEQPILGENRGDVVQETRNNFRASTSGGSEEASGSSSVKPSSSGASMLKKDDINTKLKNVTKTVR